MLTARHPVHKANKVEAYVASLNGKLTLHLLPPYAPDINPDELVWNQMRHMGTSKKPLKENESLKQRVINDLQKIKENISLIKSFFRESSVSFAGA